MKFKLFFAKKAKKELEKLDKATQKRINLAIKEKLETDPINNLIPLTGSLKSLYKFRVGDYRLICRKNGDELIIIIISVKHRKEVYKSL